MSEKKKILIVEDDDKTSHLLAQIFEEANYNYVQAYNGDSALNVVASNPPDLIVLDILLPDIDGFTICQKLKMDPKTNLIPIIMLTALSRREDFFTGLKVGADKYLTKPFDVDTLLKEIKELFILIEQLSHYPHSEVIHFTLNSELKHLNHFNNLLSTVLMRTSLSHKEVEEIKVGLYEIVTNAIEWGNQLKKHLFVDVRYEILNDWLTITVKDEGKGFNLKEYLKSHSDVFHQQEQRLNVGKRLGGFGLRIAKSCFDSFSYDEEANVIILKKQLMSVN